MTLLSVLSSFFRRRYRKAYNKGSYSRSLRLSKASFLVFGDTEGLDVAARSALKLGSYGAAAKLYAKADSSGLVLRDHGKNQFNSELSNDNISGAFRASLIIERKEDWETAINLLSRKLLSLSEADRFQQIRELSAISDLPKKISDLHPDSVSRITKRPGMKNSYTIPTKEKISHDRGNREITRLRESPSYVIGELLVSAYRKPWRILLLPFTLPILGYKLVREKSKRSAESINLHDNRNEPVDGNRNCIVMFPTNGVGFGHFTRLLAISRKLKNTDPSLEIVFFTTMPTLHILYDEDIIAYHIPGRNRYEELDPTVWNSLAEEMLSLIFSLHRPKAFVFDGAYPYRGMLNSIKNRKKLMKIWVRRGVFKKNTKPIPVDSINHFDAIVRPGDSLVEDSTDEVEHGAIITRCNPILLLDNNQRLPKGELRRRLGIPESAILAYIQLGAGNVNDIRRDIQHTLDAIHDHPEMYAVIGESLLGSRITFDKERVRILRDYPNSMFFNDFDFSVQAGGYNSFHEVIESSLPSICYPNLNTGRDDQLARTLVAQKVGCMIVLKDRNKKLIRAAIDRISDSEVRGMMRENAKILQRPNGASQLADWILESIGN